MLKYTMPHEAWNFHKQVHESFGHRFGPPSIEEFTHVGTKYTAVCQRCGKTLYVSGGWGGPAAFGRAAYTNCAAPDNHPDK